MHANEPIEIALRVTALEHARKLKKRLKRAMKGDPDGVHDARTHLRRVRVDVELMGRSVFDGGAAAQIEDRLHDLERALAKARDSDVLLASFAAYARAHADAKDALEPLLKRLKKRRAKGAREAHDLLARSGKRALRDVRDFAEDPARLEEDGNGSPRAKPSLVRHFTHDEIWHRYDALRAFDARALVDPEELHKFRAACRSLRYALEVFEDAIPKSAALVRDLRGLQDQIGEMHDHHVAAALVERWMRTGKLRASRALEELALHERSRRDELRATLGDRWTRALGAEFRARLSSALAVEH